jgi:hypothetical protein
VFEGERATFEGRAFRSNWAPGGGHRSNACVFHATCAPTPSPPQNTKGTPHTTPRSHSRPQQATAPVERAAQAKKPPAATATALLVPRRTVNGPALALCWPTVLSQLVFRPSWPAVLSPQHWTSPVAPIRAQAKLLPPVMAVAPARFATWWGAGVGSRGRGRWGRAFARSAVVDGRGCMAGRGPGGGANGGFRFRAALSGLGGGV